MNKVGFIGWVGGGRDKHLGMGLETFILVNINEIF